MGFFGKLGGALKSAATAPIRATGALAKGAHGATKAAVTGHPIAAGKKLFGGGMQAGKTMARPISRRR